MSGRIIHMQAITEFLRRHGGVVLDLLSTLYIALKRRRGQQR